MPRRVIRTREGTVVDSDTGEVIDDRPIDFEHPEYRVYTHDDYMRKSHYEPMVYGYSGERLCIDDRLAEELISILIPGLVEILKAYLRKSICRANIDEINRVFQSLWGSEGAEIVQSIIQKKLSLSPYESRVHDVSGLLGLATFRCLKSAGFNEEKVFEAINSVVDGKTYRDEEIYSIVKALLESLRNARLDTYVRWVSKPLEEEIDLEYASRVLGTEIKIAKNVSYILTRVNELGVQITRTKIDISSKANDYQKVLSAIDYLSRRLGVTLSKPIPMIATTVIRLPFKINLNLLERFENAQRQGNRVKFSRGSWTALVYTSTVNLYINLQGNINRIDTDIVEVLPIVCTYIEKK
ncbi:hypothetical protein Igag_1639 [Ignisphaera aggregans DSM 17230]|uniref:Uncharacterized protein n=1 Tax=Ignisphaera aggregans (strain DSM 17230 / JCM 13409 / AQ1.S1) TaxID=583356 RepID=E0SRQ6_IGNAA|nr:hypothetical protein Igag_1639 [Ignisphaera aggregans DSM 17230]